MADRKTVAVRSELAATLAHWLSHPGSFSDGRETYLDFIDSHDTVALVAAPFENAALTIHRMERQGAAHVILATRLDGDPFVIGFGVATSPLPGRTRVDVPGSMTTEEFVSRVRDNLGRESYTADGWEFAPAVNELAPALMG